MSARRRTKGSWTAAMSGGAEQPRPSYSCRIRMWRKAEGPGRSARAEGCGTSVGSRRGQLPLLRPTGGTAPGRWRAIRASRALGRACSSGRCSPSARGRRARPRKRQPRESRPPPRVAKSFSSSGMCRRGSTAEIQVRRRRANVSRGSGGRGRSDRARTTAASP